jgi:hypothetical protein
MLSCSPTEQGYGDQPHPAVTPTGSCAEDLYQQRSRSLNTTPVAYPGFFFGEGSTNSVKDRGQRERGSGGGSPLVRGCGGSCNLVQEISFHIVKFS